MTSYPFKSLGGPGGVWPHPSTIEYACYVRGGAATAGDLYQQDFKAIDAATSTAGLGNIGVSTHIMANVIAPDIAHTGTDTFEAGALHDSSGPFFGVAVRSGADDTLVRLCMFGYCSAFVIDTVNSVAIGDRLRPDASKNLNAGALANARIIAQAQEAMTTPSTRTLGEVLINGVAQFCNGHFDASP